MSLKSNRVSVLKGRVEPPAPQLPDYPRIAPGTYLGYCKWAGIYRDPAYKSWRCLLRWDLLNEGGDHLIAEVPIWLCMGDREKPRATRRMRYTAEWLKAKGGPPGRRDRLSPRVFVHRFARVRVGDTKGPMPYSVVKEIVSWETGGLSGHSVSNVTQSRKGRYVDARQRQGAKNATINRELAALKRMFRLGQQATPAKVLRMPNFPHLRENNVRKGFLEDSQYRTLVEGGELWFRALVECGRTYGWRVSELLNMQVAQVDLAQRVIRLEPGTTKNSDGREVVMTDALHGLLTACVQGKAPKAAVFTRSNGKPVRCFRDAWEKACTSAGVGQLLCAECSEPMLVSAVCRKCSGKRTRYVGLIFHDLRRTAARNLRRAGIPETVIMKIGGWRTRSVFERYAIVSRTDIADAMRKLQQSDRESADWSRNSHVATAPSLDAQSKSIN